MQTVARIDEVREQVRNWRRAAQKIVLVPTMGNLHAGHASLLQLAKTFHGRTVVSIFVNPLQFGPTEDFAQYPRTPAEDASLLEHTGADLLFMPQVDEMYPLGQTAVTRVEVPGLSDVLCGAYRPGHFTGVATVVAKLFNIVQPDIAIFGAKDFQQLAIIRRMVADLCMPIELVAAPTMREADGLAMSSRNRYLTVEERAIAPRLYATLAAATQKIQAGLPYAQIEKEGLDALIAAELRPDYFEVRDAETLLTPTNATREMVILTAARLGKARLIDNVQVERS